MRRRTWTGLPALIAVLLAAAAAVALYFVLRDDDESAGSVSTTPYTRVVGALRSSLPLRDLSLKPPPDRVSFTFELA